MVTVEGELMQPNNNDLLDQHVIQHHSHHIQHLLSLTGNRPQSGLDKARHFTSDLMTLVAPERRPQQDKFAMSATNKTDLDPLSTANGHDESKWQPIWPPAISPTQAASSSIPPPPLEQGHISPSSAFINVANEGQNGLGRQFDDDWVSCAGCRTPIIDQFYHQVASQSWHEECLRCSICGVNLTGRCHAKDGRLYCRYDFVKQYGPRCTACHKVILPTDLVQLARSAMFHLYCFKCALCERQLARGDQFCLTQNDQNVICHDHYSHDDSMVASNTSPSFPPPPPHFDECQLERSREPTTDGPASRTATGVLDRQVGPKKDVSVGGILEQLLPTDVKLTRIVNNDHRSPSPKSDVKIEDSVCHLKLNTIGYRPGVGQSAITSPDNTITMAQHPLDFDDLHREQIMKKKIDTSPSKIFAVDSTGSESCHMLTSGSSIDSKPKHPTSPRACSRNQPQLIIDNFQSIIETNGEQRVTSHLIPVSTELPPTFQRLSSNHQLNQLLLGNSTSHVQTSQHNEHNEFDQRNASDCSNRNCRSLMDDQLLSSANDDQNLDSELVIDEDDLPDTLDGNDEEDGGHWTGNTSYSPNQVRLLLQQSSEASSSQPDSEIGLYGMTHHHQPPPMMLTGPMCQGGGASGTKRRGPRTTIKAKQLDTLKAAFSATPKPTRHVRESLARETGLSMRVIQVWFQNRRSKERRMKQLNASGGRRTFYRNSRRLRGIRPGGGFIGLGLPCPAVNGLPAISNNNSTMETGTILTPTELMNGALSTPYHGYFMDNSNPPEFLNAIANAATASVPLSPTLPPSTPHSSSGNYHHNQHHQFQPQQPTTNGDGGILFGSPMVNNDHSTLHSNKPTGPSAFIRPQIGSQSGFSFPSPAINSLPGRHRSGPDNQSNHEGMQRKLIIPSPRPADCGQQSMPDLLTPLNNRTCSPSIVFPGVNNTPLDSFQQNELNSFVNPLIDINRSTSQNNDPVFPFLDRNLQPYQQLLQLTPHQLPTGLNNHNLVHPH